MVGRLGEKVLYESGEDYLEAILMLEEERGRVFAIDISKQLEVSKASVSKALTKLEERGFVQMDGRSVLLTDAGRDVAQSVLRRHRYFTRFLINAGVDPETAAEEACHMEHAISAESFDKVEAAYPVSD